MSVPTTAVDLDTTASNNSPAGSEAIGTSLDDYLRALSAIIKQLASQGSSIASAGTITPAANGSYFSVTGTTTITTIASANSWNGREIALVFSGALTLTHNASTLILPGGASITTASGDVAYMVQESAGAWRCSSYQKANGSSISLGYTVGTGANNLVQLNGSAQLPAVDGSLLTGIAVGGQIQGAFKNLQSSATGTSASVSVSYDEIALEDGSNAYVTARSGSLTINSAGSGANGLDTGTLAASTWYSVWVIRKPDGTTAGLISLSATAPTMPSGYTFKARVGWIRTDGTGNKYPLSFVQFGRRIQYKVASGSNVTGLPQMASGAAGSATVPTWVAIGVGSFVPSTATSIKVAIAINASMAMILAPNNSYGNHTSSTAPPPYIYGNTSVNYPNSVTLDISLESQNIYWGNSGAGAIVSCYGWEDSL